MYKFAIALALSCTLAACGKSEAPSQPTAPAASTVSESQKADALRQFTDRKPAKIRTLAEIQAEEKAAKEAKNAAQK